MSFKVIEHRAHKTLAGGKVRLADVSTFWREWQGVFSEAPFQLAGVARLIIDISETGQGALISFVFQNELGKFSAPRTLAEDWDHFVEDDILIPIRVREVNQAFAILKENDIALGEPTTLPRLFSLMKACRDNGIPLQAPNDFANLSKFEPKAGLLQGFLADPYPYQAIGINWLTDYYDEGLGMLLCDEMGLGKTIQAIGLVAHALNSGAKRVLIVTPAANTPNWQAEFGKFLPSAELIFHGGPTRAATSSQLDCALVLTSYETLVRDSGIFQELAYDLVIADEAQALKNFKSKRREKVDQLNARTKLLMTGTPLENDVLNLMSLVDVVAPGLFGDLESFENLAHDDPELARDIGRQASPLILRRRVREVAKDLPALIEIPTPLEPSVSWAKVYNAALLSQSPLLAKYTALTQICCSPLLVEPGFVDGDADVKLARLSQILDEISAVGDEKALIFTTYIESINILERFLRRNFDATMIRRIDGSIPPVERQRIINEFNAKVGFAVLIINPTAGGVGLNITGANHVIHFNRQWNPALEAQATARAYRRGQEKPVRVHNFYYQGTIEELIQNRLAQKIHLAEVALRDAEGISREIGADLKVGSDLSQIESLKPLNEQNG
jgi:SNF2 family DNA or RNA helicase